MGATRAASWGALGSTTTYAYDAAGNLAEKNDPRSVKTTYTYDAAHRLIQHAQTQAGTPLRTTQLTWDALRRMKRIYAIPGFLRRQFAEILMRPKRVVTTLQLAKRLSFSLHKACVSAVLPAIIRKKIDVRILAN